MATHSSILAQRIPWTEELGGLQSMGSQRVGRDQATDTFTFRDFPGGPGLRLHVSNAGDVDLFTGRGTKIPHVVQHKYNHKIKCETTIENRRQQAIGSQRAGQD